MAAPTIARTKPYLVEVREGKTYFWCACGLSSKQPYCDGSHEATEFEPVRFTADKNEEVLLCACKRTASQPFCDGAHNRLSDAYEEATERPHADAVLVDFRPATDGVLKAELDNGCYVIRVPQEAMSRVGELQVYPVIGAGTGARRISQYSALLTGDQSPVMRYGDCDVVLFIRSGTGTVGIGDRAFPVSVETGVCVKPGEAFQLTNSDVRPIEFDISICPQCDTPEYPDEMPSVFDASVPQRVQGVDESKREAMADRSFQVLIDAERHGTPVTQFIGSIPESRAAHHRHLYEETITVLSGEGFMWTDETKAPVRPGDTIFLPLKQAHSLECTSPEGMRLIGLFYPSMSPAINY